MFFYQFDRKNAIEYLKKSSELFNDLGDFDLFVESNYNIGQVYFDEGQIVQALNIYKKAYAMKDRIKDKKIVSTIYSNIAVIYISHYLGGRYTYQ